MTKRLGKRSTKAGTRDPKGYLSLKQAAEALGMTDRWAGRRLGRMLVAKEKARKVSIILRVGGTEGPRWKITMAALRRWCPELFDRRDEIVGIMQENLEEIREQIGELFQRQDALATAVERMVSEPRRTVRNHSAPIG